MQIFEGTNQIQRMVISRALARGGPARTTTVAGAHDALGLAAGPAGP
jgi:hypothetical protein